MANFSLTPTSIAHFGIRTTPEKLDDMIKWHTRFFQARVSFRMKNAAFLAYDDEHHRIVIVANGSPKPIEDKRTASLVYHIAFAFNSLEHLGRSYEQKKAVGIAPHWVVNHGPTTSMYYYDPDGNEFETQVDNFDSAEGAQKFMESPAFVENPIGVDFVPEDMIRRVQDGEDEATIKKRPDIGPRAMRQEKSIYY